MAERRTLVRLVLPAVLAGAVLLLVVAAPSLEPGRLHVHGRFVDQAGYVTTARHLVDEGELAGQLLYPSEVREPGWRLYMPGMYLALGLAYAVLGYGAWTSLLPALLGYLVVVGAVLLAAGRRYGTRAGIAAALVAGLFPGMVPYAFTAMPQVPAAAAIALGLVLVLALRPRARPFAAPLAVALPFLFNELAALTALPIVLLCLIDPGSDPGDEEKGLERPRRVPAALAGVLCVLVALAIRWQQEATGKGSVPLSWVTRGFFNYHDAFLPPEPELGAGAWVSALATNLARNAGITWNLVRRDPLQLAVTGQLLLVLGTGICLVAGARRWRRDPLPLGAGLLALALLGASYVLYDVRDHKLVRLGLLVVPWVAVGVAASLRTWLAGRGRALAAGAGLLALCAVVTEREGREMLSTEAESDELVERIARFQPAPDRVVMVDFVMAKKLLAYAVEGYPRPWSFLAGNDRTFELVLEQGHDVGLVVLRTGNSPLSPDLLARQRMHVVDRFESDGESFAVLERPRAP